MVVVGVVVAVAAVVVLIVVAPENVGGVVVRGTREGGYSKGLGWHSLVVVAEFSAAVAVAVVAAAAGWEDSGRQR